MRTSNRSDRVSKLKRFKLRKNVRRLATVVVPIIVLIFAVGLVKWNLLPMPRDAGPTELSVHDRLTLIEKSDFECYSPISSLFTVSAYNPGWELGFIGIGGGEAYAIFDVVGDLDLCIWADDYTLSMDEAGDVLVIDVERIDIRRPRVDMNPREFNGVTYQTLKLNSATEDRLANANIDRLVWEGVRNFFSGNDKTYIDEMQQMLLQFGENSLIETACYPQAIEVVREGVYQHYMRQSQLFGFTEVEVFLPETITIPVVPDYFDSGDTELQVVGEETCQVNEA